MKFAQKHLASSVSTAKFQPGSLPQDPLEAERMLDHLFTHSRAPFVILDRDFNFIRVNDAYARVCDRDVSEFVGRNHFELFPSDAEQIFKRVRMTKEPYEVSARPFVFTDHPEWGVTYWDWSLVPVLDDEGEVAYFVFSLNDVTENKKKQDSLERLNQTLMVLSKCNAALVRATDEKALVSSICEIISDEGGNARASVEYTETILRNAAAPDDSDPNPLEIAVRTGEACVERGIKPSGQESHWRSIAASQGYSAMIALPLVVGPEVLGALNICSRDDEAFGIDEVKILLELASDLAYGIKSLRGREQQKQDAARIHTLTSAIEQSPVLILITDECYRIKYVNKAFKNVSGYDEEDVLGITPYALKSDLVPLDDYKKQWSEKPRHRDWTTVIPCKKKDGTEFWAEVRVSQIRNSKDRVTHYMETARDVTDRRQMEQELAQARKMEGLGTLAGTVAHDFNNMLLPILSLSQMTLKELPDGSRGQKRLAKVIEAGEKARSLIARIMAFSRNTDVTREPLELDDLAEEVAELIRSTMPKNVKVNVDIETIPFPVLADASQLQTVVMNLAGNAAHAMKGKAGKLNMALSMVEVDGEFAQKAKLPSIGRYGRLVVEDTGHGIDHQTMEKIFDPFFTTKEKGEGTGLGLASVHSIITNHGGNVQVESEVGKGTTFEIYLPLMEPGRAGG